MRSSVILLWHTLGAAIVSHLASPALAGEQPGECRAIDARYAASSAMPAADGFRFFELRSGGLIAHQLDPGGEHARINSWNTSVLDRTSEDRRVIVANNDGSTGALTWESIDADRRARFGDAGALGSFREGLPSLHGLRAEQHSFGPPLVAGPPALGPMRSEEHVRFAQKHAMRKPMVYVTSNRGTLLAIDATTGAELFTFVPSASVSDVRSQTAHSAPASLALGDAPVAGTWRSVLIAGTNQAGGSVYALDVTAPIAFDELERFSDDFLLWEFDDEGRLGENAGPATIARLRNGEWVAILGNGTAPNASPALYVLNVADGSLLGKIATPLASSNPGANGLGAPAVVDVDGDGAVEFAYAGDLQGRLWKFDLRAADPDGWGVALDGRALFEARTSGSEAQSTMDRPEVVRGDDGASLGIIFSGRGAQTSTLYAVMDRDLPVDGRNKLRALKFAPDIRRESAWMRALSRDRSMANSEGWYIDLVSSSGEPERLIAPLSVRDRRVVFATQASTGRCEARLTWTIAIDALIHTATAHPPSEFAVDRAALSTSGATTAEAIVGIGVETDYRVSGTVLSLTRSAPGTCEHLIYSPGASLPLSMYCRSRPGRHSWRQLR